MGQAKRLSPRYPDGHPLGGPTVEGQPQERVSRSRHRSPGSRHCSPDHRLTPVGTNPVGSPARLVVSESLPELAALKEPPSMVSPSIHKLAELKSNAAAAGVRLQGDGKP